MFVGAMDRACHPRSANGLVDDEALARLVEAQGRGGDRWADPLRHHRRVADARARRAGGRDPGWWSRAARQAGAGDRRRRLQLHGPPR